MTQRQVVITSAEGQRFVITFDREAYRCWRVVAPDYCQDVFFPNGYSSLALAMADVAEQILKTEF